MEVAYGVDVELLRMRVFGDVAYAGDAADGEGQEEGVWTSCGWMTKRPLGLRQSEAILARNLLGATPAEAVRLSSSRICCADGGGYAGGGGEVGVVLGDVEVGFVEGEGFDEVGVWRAKISRMARETAV